MTKAVQKASYGGLAARSMKGPMWKFTGEDGSFAMPAPDFISGLYFPICNLAGMKSSVTADFKGDVCRDFASFLTIPTDVEDLHRLTNSRNFWVSVPGQQPWSATGVSAAQAAQQWDQPDEVILRAGPGHFQVARTSRRLKLKATVSSFVPSSDDMVELMKVTVENVGSKPVRFTGTFATPIFGRHADHLRDHRTVTTMFNQVFVTAHGTLVKPTIHHDERGHTPNPTHYGVMGATGRGEAPKEVWGNARDFLGEGGKYDSPEAVFCNLKPPKRSDSEFNGREAISAMRFAPVTLKPGKSATFVFVFAISDDRRDLGRWLKKYGTGKAVDDWLDKTVDFWRKLSGNVCFKTDDPNYGNWMRWVATQPIYRKVYGNSYLLDFGYGRGGRGWRDLWSDLLSVFLVYPEAAREEILNNFTGIRIDGTNATIIGTAPGEFVADRNSIVRSWCDHGAWPFHVLKFYIDQTGDFDVLLKDQPYWKDQFCFRSKQIDDRWERSQGNRLRTRQGDEYRGSIMEHILLELLSAFYHVGEHNNILLEGADWNDTYDGARKKGESVCFTSYYGHDLAALADVLEMLQKNRPVQEVGVLEEVLTLLDRLPGQQAVDYASWREKRQRLSEYFEKVSHAVSGNRVKVKVSDLVADLRAKSQAICEHIRNNEFVTTTDGESFFNGHYDDDGLRVHGDNPHGVRMDLTSQVFPTMFGVATDEQVRKVYSAARRYLRDKRVGGLHLCTNLEELKLNLGRVAGFTYGYKEHGGIWNQMNVMFMNALYTRNFVQEGYEVFKDVYDLCMNTAVSRVFPCIPSFFDIYGRGGYSYLTGSATWLMLATLTQMFGLRGEGGDLRIEPKLVREQFGESGRAEASFEFGGKRLHVVYVNPNRRDWGRYSIKAVTVNGKGLNIAPANSILLGRQELLGICTRATNQVEVTLD